MSPIKILQIINSQDIGGAEIMLLSLLDGLNRKFIQPIICIIGNSPLADKARLRGCEVRQLPIYKGKKDIQFLVKLIRLVQHIKPDIIQSHIWFTNLYACLCGRILNIPVISTFHSNYLIETFPERISLKIIYYLSKKFVVVSNYQIGHFGFTDKLSKITVIMNGIEIPKLIDNAKKMVKLGAQFKLDPKEKVITFVGNLRPIKGHVFLLQAIQLILKEYKNIRLLLVGDGPLKNDLVKQCDEYNISDKVNFLGFRDDITDILSITDIFVCPSLNEANSIAIMEAMAISKPIIATNVGGNCDLIDDAKDGLLVPPKDHKAIADKIRLLLKNEYLALKLGNNARSKSVRNFNIDNMTKNYERLYNEIKKKR